MNKMIDILGDVICELINSHTEFLAVTLVDTINVYADYSMHYSNVDSNQCVRVGSIVFSDDCLIVIRNDWRIPYVDYSDDKFIDMFIRVTSLRY